MNAFLSTVLSFPTVPWSVLLAGCAVYWALASTGLLHHGDGGVNGHAGHHAGDGAVGVGLLARVGLGGVPVTVAMTLLAFVGWVLTYFVHLLLLTGLPGGLRAGLGLVTLAASVVVGTALTAVLLRPLRAVNARLSGPRPRPLAGRVGTVTSAHVDDTSGRAAFEDGGAGLILEVRAPPPDRPRRGDRVVILDHDPVTHTYTVVTEDHFDA